MKISTKFRTVLNYSATFVAGVIITVTTIVLYNKYSKSNH